MTMFRHICVAYFVCVWCRTSISWFSATALCDSLGAFCMSKIVGFRAFVAWFFDFISSFIFDEMGIVSCWYFGVCLHHLCQANTLAKVFEQMPTNMRITSYRHAGRLPQRPPRVRLPKKQLHRHFENVTKTANDYNDGWCDTPSAKVFTLNPKNGKGPKLRRNIKIHGGLIISNFHFRRIQHLFISWCFLDYQCLVGRVQEVSMIFLSSCTLLWKFMCIGTASKNAYL